MGININKLTKHVETRGSLQGYIDFINDKEILTRNCNILVSARNHRAININNIEDLKCNVLVEGINGSTSIDADKIANKMGILMIPDLIGNAGGLISSYLEWIKNIQHKRPGRLTKKWEEKSKGLVLKAIQDKLEEKGYKVDLEKAIKTEIRGADDKALVKSTIEGVISETIDNVLDRCKLEKCNMREASFALAIERINASFNYGYLFTN